MPTGLQTGKLGLQGRKIFALYNLKKYKPYCKASEPQCIVYVTFISVKWRHKLSLHVLQNIGQVKVDCSDYIYEQIGLRLIIELHKYINICKVELLVSNSQMYRRLGSFGMRTSVVELSDLVTASLVVGVLIGIARTCLQHNN